MIFHCFVLWPCNILQHTVLVHYNYRISSYKTLPRIIPATLIIPAILITLCRGNVVFSNKTRIWRLHEIIIPAGLIWGDTVFTNFQLLALLIFVQFLSWDIIWEHWVKIWNSKNRPNLWNRIAAQNHLKRSRNHGGKHQARTITEPDSWGYKYGLKVLCVTRGFGDTNHPSTNQWINQTRFAHILKQKREKEYSYLVIIIN